MTKAKCVKKKNLTSQWPAGEIAMESETLRNIGTMRQVKTSLAIARSQKLKTTNSLSRTKEEIVYLNSVTDPRLEQILAKERKRFAVLEAAIDKSRQHLLQQREKLAMTVNKNRALTELRYELQRARWEGNDPVAPKAEMPASKPRLHRVELSY